MDSLFHLKEMSDKDKQLFMQDRISKEQELTQHMEQRDSLLQMENGALREQYKKKREEIPEGEMPQLRADEKEFRRKRREEKQFKRQLGQMKESQKEQQKTANGSVEQRAEEFSKGRGLDPQAQEMFSKTLSPEQFTPRYVLEHFAEVRETLDSWRDHLALMEQKEIKDWISSEKKFRLNYMQEMYTQAEEAFSQALRALGYEYHVRGKKSEVVSLSLDGEQKKQALEENRRLRTSLAKAGEEIDEKVAGDLIESACSQLHNRKDSPKQRIELEKLNALLQEHPEQYKEKKELVDKLCKEAYLLEELIDVCNEKAQAVHAIKNKKVSAVAALPGVHNGLDVRFKESIEEATTLYKREMAMLAAVRHILTGSELTEEQLLSVASVIPMDALVQERQEGGKARVYAELYRTKQSETGAEGETEDAEASVRQYLERVRSLDTRELGHCTDAELAERAEVLQELAVTGLTLATAQKQKADRLEAERLEAERLEAERLEAEKLKAGKLKAEKLKGTQEVKKQEVKKQEAPKLTLWEILCGKDKSLLVMKCCAIQAYAAKARAVAMIRAYRLNELTEDSFLTEELEELRRKMELEQGEPLSKEQLLFAAREMLEKALAEYDRATSAYFQSPEAKERYMTARTPEGEAPHAAYRSTLAEAEQAGAEYLHLSQGSLNVEQMRKFYKLCGEKIAELKAQLTHAEGMANLELLSELEKYQGYQQGIEQLYALEKHSYKKAGEIEAAMGEPLFGALKRGEGLEAFRDMSEEAFAEMCRQLSAGALSEDARTAEGKKRYAAENRKGLESYKKELQKYYEKLEQQFGHRVPSVEYIEEHFSELNRLFDNIQADLHMVDEMRDLIDLTKPEDLRLYHLVHAYNAIAGYVKAIVPVASYGEMNFRAVDAFCRPMIQAAEESFAYLGQAPVEKDTQTLKDNLADLTAKKAEYEDEQEWIKDMEEAESPLKAEEFRKIGEDSHNILEKDEQTMLAYLEQVSGLAEYVHRYENVDSLHMRQFRGWLSMAQKQIPLISEKWFQSRIASKDWRDVDKRKEAQRYNLKANEESFDFLRAQKKADGWARNATFEEISGRISYLMMTESMLSMDYITLNKDTLLKDFAAMDEYRARTEADPALEDTLPAARKIAWRKDGGIYERYREYVTKVARLYHVDMKKGAYLEKEIDKEERRTLATEIINERTAISDILQNFRSSKDLFRDMSDWVKNQKELGEQDKAAIKKSIEEAGIWLGDLRRYLEQEMNIANEEVFDAKIMTLISMLGYLEKNLREAETLLQTAHTDQMRNTYLPLIQTLRDTFLQAKERIPGCAADYRELLLASGTEQRMRLYDVMLSAQGTKVFTLSGQETNVGAGSSDVIRIKEGEKNYFFKEDEKLEDLYEELEELPPILENELLQNRVAELIRQAKEGTAAYREEVRRAKRAFDESEMESTYHAVGDLRSFGDSIVNLRQQSGETARRIMGTIESILRMSISWYVAENPEKWEKFSTMFARRFTTDATAKGLNLKLDNGADMTARNYASERVAELFGMKNLIVRNTEAVLIQADGTEKKGFVMEQAKGKTIVALREEVSAKGAHPGYEIKVEGEAQKQLLNLQIMDNIIGQVDRNEGNYFLEYQVDDQNRCIRITGVTGIDNDFAFGKSLRLSGEATKSVLDYKKEYSVGMMDKALYERMQAISPELLTIQLEGLIEPEYLEPLAKRYETMRQKIREAKVKADAAGIDFFREKDGWGEETEKEQRRYMGLFIQRILDAV